jgi:hypothetical protein
MSVRIEIPDHVLDLNELSGGDDPSIPVHHVKGEIKIHSYVKVKNVKYLQDKIVNEKKECGKVL